MSKNGEQKRGFAKFWQLSLFYASFVVVIGIVVFAPFCSFLIIIEILKNINQKMVNF